MAEKITTLGEVFAEAGKLIEVGQNTWICFAIADLHLGRRISCGQEGRAKAIVAKRLQRHSHYHYWVAEHHPAIYAATADKAAAARAGRVAWCKALAQEFKGVKL